MSVAHPSSIAVRLCQPGVFVCLALQGCFTHLLHLSAYLEEIKRHATSFSGEYSTDLIVLMFKPPLIPLILYKKFISRIDVTAMMVFVVFTCVGPQRRCAPTSHLLNEFGTKMLCR